MIKRNLCRTAGVKGQKTEFLDKAVIKVLKESQEEERANKLRGAQLNLHDNKFYDPDLGGEVQIDRAYNILNIKIKKLRQAPPLDKKSEQWFKPYMETLSTLVHKQDSDT